MTSSSAASTVAERVVVRRIFRTASTLARSTRTDAFGDLDFDIPPATVRLLEVNCRTIEQMRLANALCRFVEKAT
jgi:hypothetical protein